MCQPQKNKYQSLKLNNKKKKLNQLKRSPQMSKRQPKKLLIKSQSRKRIVKMQLQIMKLLNLNNRKKFLKKRL